MGEDELAATAEGTGRIAVAANFLLEQLNELTSTHVHLDPNGAPAGPLIVTDPTDRHYLGLISPVRWPPNREIS
jgi:DNA polymerase III sliding clamp (beta) subunit (PCNA family)